MSQVSVTFQLGNESVTSVLDVDLDTETILTGDIGGLVPVGTVARLRGNCRLIDSLHIRGTLLCDPSGVDLDGQSLFDIHTHDGTLNLVGTEKTAWVNWGDPVVGWQTGDRLGIAPTKAAVYTPSEMTWTGTWASMTRPANSPDVTLVDGSIAKPEVVNLSQTVTLRNLKRIMIHESSVPNPQTFKWVRVLDSGEANVLGMYPIHFHMIGDYARGSYLEGVVVEGGKNHAFVPHASHGITFERCAAYNTLDEVYWWDAPTDATGGLANLSEDILYRDCLAMSIQTSAGGDPFNVHGFTLMAGVNLSCIGCVTTCNRGSKSSAGFEWPSKANQKPNLWIMEDCVAHNNKSNGIRVWQNDGHPHIVRRFTSYRNGNGIEHGAYINIYRYIDVTDSLGPTTSPKPYGFDLHANAGSQGPIEIADMKSDRPLNVSIHTLPYDSHTIVRNSQFSTVSYLEHGVGNPSGGNPSYIEYHDCGMTRTSFTLTRIKQDSVIELWTAGAMVDRWSNGGWQ